MKAFSVEKALGAGFGLIKREPLAVLMWGVAYVVMTVVIQAIALGPALGAVLTGVLSDPEDAEAAVEQAMQANALITFPLIFLLSIGAYAILYGAIARAELHPEDRRFFFLRLSKRELWLALSYLALTVLAVLAIVVACIPVFLIVRVVSIGEGQGMLASGLLVGVPALVGLLYLGARLSMTWLMAFEEERFVLFDSWALTRGQGWRLVVLTLALMFLLIIATIGVFLAFLVVGGILAFVAKSAGAAGAVLGVLAIIAAVVAYVALFGAMYAVLLAPYIEAYRGIRAAQAGKVEAA
jgi:hypothetical protein